MNIRRTIAVVAGYGVSALCLAGIFYRAACASVSVASEGLSSLSTEIPMMALLAVAGIICAELGDALFMKGSK